MSDTQTIPKLNGLQKAAVFLVAMGTSDSAGILKRLSEDQVDQLSRAVARLGPVQPEQVEEILQEYHQYVTSQKLLVRGGVEYAGKMLLEAFGPEVAMRLIARLKNGDQKVFENFRKADPLQLAKFIQDEHPQTIALILCHLEPTQAAKLMSALPSELHKEIAIRMAQLNEISPEIIRTIAGVIDQKLGAFGEVGRKAVGGVRSLANMFNRLDPTTRTDLLAALETDDPPLFENVRRLMFVFADLEKVDQASIKILITKVDRKSLVLGLKGANESLRTKFVSTQSSRGAEMLLEDIASTGPVKLRDVDAAQQQIIATARELEKEGAITLSGGGDDQYVE